MPPTEPGKDRVEALLSVCRAEDGGRAKSEIETAAICIGAALAGEDTPEGDAGLQLFAYALLDLHGMVRSGPG